jgi:hypothetical protein
VHQILQPLALHLIGKHPRRQPTTVQTAFIIKDTLAKTAPNRRDHLRSAEKIHPHDVIRVQPAITALLQEFCYGRLSAAHASGDSNDALHNEVATD